jgi:hypothetical protein
MKACRQCIWSLAPQRKPRMHTARGILWRVVRQLIATPGLGAVCSIPSTAFHKGEPINRPEIKTATSVVATARNANVSAINCNFTRYASCGGFDTATPDVGKHLAIAKGDPDRVHTGEEIQYQFGQATTPRPRFSDRPSVGN